MGDLDETQLPPILQDIADNAVVLLGGDKQIYKTAEYV